MWLGRPSALMVSLTWRRVREVQDLSDSVGLEKGGCCSRVLIVDGEVRMKQMLK